MKQPAQAVFLGEERSFCAPLKKEGGGKQREPRDIWPVHSRGIFFQSVSSKIQRRNTNGNCGELLQRRFFIGSLKGGFARRGGIMSRGVQCIMESKECGQKAFLFSECRCKFVCSRTRVVRKNWMKRGWSFRGRKGMIMVIVDRFFDEFSLFDEWIFILYESFCRILLVE